MGNIDKHHPKPCASCGHRNLHGELSGCIANNADVGQPADWCSCTTYVAPDRAPGRAEGRARAQAGGEAALHGYAMNDGTWRTAADNRMAELIAAAVVFCADDVTDVVGVPDSPNAIGGLFRAHRSQLQAVGVTTCSRPEAHGRMIRTWQAKA